MSARATQARLAISAAFVLACASHGEPESLDAAPPPIAAEPLPLTWVVSELGERWRDDLHAKEERRKLRETLRSFGKRVCEEGEWPQYWAEDCNRCECQPGHVRTCTMAHCRRRGSGRAKAAGVVTPR